MLITTNNKELVRFIRKETVIKCVAVVYEINYGDIYLSKNTSGKIREKDVSGVKLATHVNANVLRNKFD